MRLSFSFVAFCFIAKLVLAATYTVDNANSGAADFDSLPAAVSSVLPGDTLILMGSPKTYAAVTLDKELHLRGPGWHHELNYPDASPQRGALVEKITINSLAGANSSIRSMQVGTIDLDDTANILIERVAPYYDSPTEGWPVYLQINDCSLITLRQSYYVYVQGGTLNNSNTQLKILNNVLRGLHTSAAFSQIENNIMRDGLITVKGATFRYNVIYPGENISISLENCLAEYNLCDTPQNTSDKDSWPGESNLNQVDSSTFWTGTGSFDGRFEPATGSPLLNVNGKGAEAGIFGSDHPYVLSGMPAAPVIYAVSAPATIEAGETLTLSFKVTSEPPVDDGPIGGTDL